jgi:predicted nucleic acid-binding protein
MAGFDFEKVVRFAAKLPRGALQPREDARLPFLTEDDLVGGSLMLDTCVYVDQLQGSLPEPVEEAVGRRVSHHSSVCVGEMSHVLGALRPDDRRTPGAIEAIRRLIAAIPSLRVHAPEAQTVATAGALSGVLCRTMGYGGDSKLRAFNDAVIYVQAVRQGFTVVTRNVGDFDLLQQMVPAGRILLYRRA